MQHPPHIQRDHIKGAKRVKTVAVLAKDLLKQNYPYSRLGECDSKRLMLL